MGTCEVHSALSCYHRINKAAQRPRPSLGHFYPFLLQSVTEKRIWLNKLQISCAEGGRKREANFFLSGSAGGLSIYSRQDCTLP